MTRRAVRTLKGAMRAIHRPNATLTDRVLASDCALALLARSIQFGHARLAILRLVIAVDVGAHVPNEHWAYCSGVARRSTDPQLHELYRDAATKAHAVSRNATGLQVCS